MARIRHLEIHNFRSIQALDWTPSNGVNCLIGSARATELREEMLRAGLPI